MRLFQADGHPPLDETIMMVVVAPCCYLCQSLTPIHQYRVYLADDWSFESKMDSGVLIWICNQCVQFPLVDIEPNNDHFEFSHWENFGDEHRQGFSLQFNRKPVPKGLAPHVWYVLIKK